MTWVMSKVKTDIKWIRLGDYIEVCNETNTSGLELEILGLNIDKDFMPTVANTSTLDTTKYKIVQEGNFVFSGMQTGRDRAIRLGYYDKSEPSLISPAYTIFKVSSETVLPEYLFICFNRPEMDRYGWFVSDSSVRANLDWAVFESIQIPLPSRERQEEVVAVWQELRGMAETNEKMAENLEALSMSYIQELKYTCPHVRLGDYITVKDERNVESKDIELLGINISKEFMPTVANTRDVNKSKYKIIKQGAFAFSGMQTGRDCAIRIGYYDRSEPAIISPAYTIFQVSNNTLLPEFLFLYLRRPELDRLGWFYSDSSVRANLNWDIFLDFQIPFPTVEIQEKIAELYRSARECRKIAEKARKLSKEACPALIQSVIHD